MAFVDRPSKTLPRIGVLIFLVGTSFIGVAGVRVTADHWNNQRKVALVSELQEKQESEKSKLIQKRAELARQQADAFAENRIADVPELIVNDYVLNDQPPAIDWTTSVDPSKATFVYDKNRLCVGQAMGGQFFFVRQHPEICNR